MLALGIGVGLGLLALGYWLFVITEGTYLGPRVVTLLYDWTAPRYDRIKELSFIYEARFLGLPLVEALGGVASPRVLDVATGTGRLPLALLRELDFEGTVVGVDRSRPMMVQAQSAFEEYAGRVLFVQQEATALAFPAETFDAVTCLEALEFMGKPYLALAEMARVLKPGGVLLCSNRVGKDAWFFPCRMGGRGRLEAALQRLGLEQVRMERWQVDYDLVWARKPGLSERSPVAVEKTTRL